MKRFLAIMLCMLLAAAPVVSSASAGSDEVAPCFIFEDIIECD